MGFEGFCRSPLKSFWIWHWKLDTYQYLIFGVLESFLAPAPFLLSRHTSCMYSPQVSFACTDPLLKRMGEVPLQSATFLFMQGFVRGVTVSPDGTKAFSCGDDKARFFCWERGKLEQFLPFGTSFQHAWCLCRLPKCGIFKWKLVRFQRSHRPGVSKNREHGICRICLILESHSPLLHSRWEVGFFLFEHNSWWEGLPRANGFRDLENFHHFPDIPTLNTSCMPLRLCQASYHMAYIPGVWTLEESDHFAGLGKMEAAGHWSPLAETHVRDSWWYCTLAYLGNLWELFDGIWHFVEGTTFQNSCLCFWYLKFRQTFLQVDVWDYNRSAPLSSFEWGCERVITVWGLGFLRWLLPDPAAKSAKSRFNPAESALLASTAVDRSVGLYAEAWDVMLENSSEQQPGSIVIYCCTHVKFADIRICVEILRFERLGCVPPNQMPADYKLNF